MLCFQGDRKCHEKKKKCRSHGVSKFPTMWHTGFKIDQAFEMTWTFLCNIRPSHVVTLWNKMFEVFMKQNTNNTHNMSKKNLEEFII